MKIGVFYFPGRLRHQHRRAGARARGARLRVAVRPRAHAHPGQPQHAVPERRRVAEALRPHARPVRRAVLRRGGDEKAACSAPASASSPSATRSSPRKRSPASTSCRAAASIFGIGGGWNVEEMENHGARYNTRFKLMRERILAMKALWTAGGGRISRRDGRISTRSGRSRSRRRSRTRRSCWAARPTTRCAASSNIATAGSRGPAAAVEIREQLARLHRMAEEKGRDPKTLSTSVFRAPPDKAALAEYEEAGIDRAVLEIPDESRDEILRVLDRYAPLLRYGDAASPCAAGSADGRRLDQRDVPASIGTPGRRRGRPAASSPRRPRPRQRRRRPARNFPTFAACPAPASAVAETPATRSAFLSSAGDTQPATSRVIRTPSRAPAFFSVSAAFDPVRQASTRPRTSGVRISCPRRWAIAAIIRTWM